MPATLIADIPNWLLGVALLPALAALVIAAVLRPDLVLLFGVTTAFVYPRAVLRPGGTQVAIADLLFIGVLGAWTVARIAGRANRPRIHDNEFLLPGLAWIGFNLLSMIWSSDRKASLAFGIQMTEIVFLIPLAFYSLPRSVRSIRLAMLLFILVSSVLAVLVLVLGRDGVPDLKKNVIGTYIGVGFVMATAFAFVERQRRGRALLAIFALVLLAGLLSTISRGAIVGALLGVVTLSVLLKARRAVVIGVAIAAAVTFLATHGLNSADRHTNVAGSYDTSTLRAYAIEGAWVKIRDRPFLGTGAGTYADFIAPLSVAVNDPNNMFLLTWAEVGIGGTLALLYLLFVYGRIFWRSKTLPPDARVVSAASGAAALSLFVHFQFDVTWTRGTTSLAFAMIGVILACERLVGEPNPSPVPLSQNPTTRLSPTPIAV